jgi:hypothetical protein
MIGEIEARANQIDRQSDANALLFALQQAAHLQGYRIEPTDTIVEGEKVVRFNSFVLTKVGLSKKERDAKFVDQIMETFNLKNKTGFTTNGRGQCELTGYNGRNSKYPFLYLDKYDGKTYKCSKDVA